MSVPQYTIHPVAELFPAMSQAEFDKLKADIAANGLRQPIIIWKEQIIDGRHRYAALKELGKWSGFYEQELDDDADPIAYAISVNLTRRHLNESQRAMVAAELANMKHGGDRTPQDTKSSIELLSDDKAASMLNVGKASVKRARAVRKKAAPELANAVKEGAVSVSAAADLADAIPDKAEQAAIVARGVKAVQEEAKKARERKKAAKPKAAPKPPPDPIHEPIDEPKAATEKTPTPSRFAAVVALWKQIEDAMAEADKSERLRIRFWLSDRLDDVTSSEQNDGDT